MNISLIGMSNSGKSYWSHKLEKLGFKRFGIDELLEKKLEKGLKALGYQGIKDLAKWMRQPYEDRHRRTSATYLDYERKTMLEVLSIIEQKTSGGNNIIDTTGSVIYTGDDILQKLKNLTTIVYLETPQSIQKEMYEAYLLNPKPVIWGDSFGKKDGETNQEALKRCYKDFLAFRTNEYKKLANKIFSYQQARDPHFTPEKFIEAIKQ